MNTNFYELVSKKTNDELIAIYINPQDYQESFLDIVLEELKKRNIDLNEFEPLRSENITLTDETAREGRSGSPLYLFFCFILSLLGFVSGGISVIGIVGGAVYAFSRRKTNQGSRYFYYNKSTRELGLIILVIGLLAGVLFMINNSS